MKEVYAREPIGRPVYLFQMIAEPRIWNSDELKPVFKSVRRQLDKVYKSLWKSGNGIVSYGFFAIREDTGEKLGSPMLGGFDLGVEEPYRTITLLDFRQDKLADLGYIQYFNSVLRELPECPIEIDIQVINYSDTINHKLEPFNPYDKD